MKRLFTDTNMQAQSKPYQNSDNAHSQQDYARSITFQSLLAKQECSICNQDITKLIKIHTKAPICYNCFVNSEPPVKYIVHDRLNFKVYSPKWTALEEMLLLQGIERYGIDNWNAISDNIASKTPKECEAHFYTYYYKSRNDCYPNNGTDIISIRNSEGKIEIIEERSKKAEEKLAQYLCKKESAHDDSPDKGTESNESLGYNSFREEFSIEYDNEAEFLISDLTFLEEDTIEERQIKYDLIDLYQRRLQNRIKVRKFIIDRGLNDSKKIQINDKRKSKKGKEISQRLKKCMQFMGKSDYDSLINILSEEAEINKQLQEYTYYQ